MNKLQLSAFVLRYGQMALLFMLTSFSLTSQKRNHDVYEFPEHQLVNTREIVRIPDIEGYVTIKCDFHTHTIFSDGHVSPVMRVNEAWSNGMDAIAITDHIEYRPFKEYVVADHNKSNELATAHGKKIGFIVIKGAEITRKKPIGHLNALFIKDANKLEVSDPVDAIKEAVNQGAFILWNHPGWPNDSTTLYDIHKELIAKKLIHGVELFNSKVWYPKVMDWSTEYNLTITSNTDIHQLTNTSYSTDKNSRPMTLVFAKEKSEEGIKEALFAGRTLATFFNYVVGKEKLVSSFVRACLEVRVIDPKKGVVEISNYSDIEFTITYGDELVKLFPGKVARSTLKQNQEVTFSNCIIEGNHHFKMPLW